ncbi:hypothetical protein J42TS3_23990 [Paenibacillus vini]|uniref:Uncharacterized protein n=1 Tax=Paenibacillus vini TaxID=1476024 RepID=A0ABQ4MBN9_9BACL|nr:hypothetical protein J42TS3_23990 [Paenibacillus vini]
MITPNLRWNALLFIRDPGHKMNLNFYNKGQIHFLWGYWFEKVDDLCYYGLIAYFGSRVVYE